MAISVSDPVYQEVAQKVADHQAAVQLIQNQLDAANRSLAEWQSIQGDLLNVSAQTF